MDYSPLIEFLRQKQELTDLEKDILDTWNQMQKNPFDHASAERQVKKNNGKYPDMYFSISALPNTVAIPWEQMTDQNIWSNLSFQLGFLVSREWNDKTYGR